MKSLSRMLLVVVILAIVGAVVLYKGRKPKAVPDGPTLTLDVGNGQLLELVRIEPGEFEMGSDESEPGHDPSEAPRHKVKIDKAFYLGRYEVTQGQYQAVMGYNQAQFKGDAEQACDSPAWTDAQKFCRSLSERTGRRVRLPSEVEWEYACRAGTTTPFAFGQTLAKADAVFNWSKAQEGAGEPRHPAIAGSTRPNPWGLYDMHGSLCEWVQDAFTPDYAKATSTPAAVPPNQEGEVSYVYRGGSWRQGPEECRAAVRFAGGPELRSDKIGFRVVVEVK